MGVPNRYLAVVSILEGRGFPKRSKHQLVAEAKFDGELLSTDPVPHSDAPDFNQELAWELDKKSLQQHRLQRSSIKIQIYALDCETTMKESVGYIVMDLRSAATNKQVSKWYHLLHSKYSKLKPEMRLALYLDEDPNPVTVPAPKGSLVNATAPKGSFDLKTLVPILNEEGGFYQIGPIGTCTEEFVLSVTVAFATNLLQLIPSSAALSASTSGFFFYYSLLGNDVSNEPFHDIVNPSFPAERASVKIRSSVEALRVFLIHQPGLQIHLCCGDQSLGNCDIPLNQLLKSDSTEIYMRPVTIEGSFQLLPANQPKSQPAPLPANVIANVGVAVVLRKEDMAVKSPSRNGQSALVTGASPNVEGLALSPKREAKTKHEQKADNKLAKSGIDKKSAQTEYSDTFEDSSEDHDRGIKEKEHKEQEVKMKQNINTNSTTSPSRVLSQQKTSTCFNQVHHFTFSIDLRSLKDNHSTNIINVYLRYTYPFFGSAAPILTHPPVEIRKGSEILLPQSFCAFDFACTPYQLQETFSKVPLVVELWHRDRQLSEDILLGTTKLPLQRVASSDKSRIMSSSGSPGWRQEVSDRVSVQSSDRKLDKCAEVSLVLSLEDWGSISQPQQNQTVSVSAPKVPSLKMQDIHVSNAPQHESPRETAEYKAAIELEMWKEEQEKEFEKRMKQKESTHMKALAEEWKKRDTEREVLTQKKLAEYKQMEDQLRKTLIDLEKREKKLSINEHEVMKLRSDLQREHDRKLQEMKEASRRMQDDCNHQVELQKMKLKETEDITNKYKQEAVESERKFKGLEKEFQLFKENQSHTPEVKLQSQINLLTLEKIELDRKLDSANKSRIHYKQQWGKALKEVARLKQKEQEVAKAQLQRQQQELEHMRLRYLAAEEKEVVTKENKELEDIKQQINKLKQMEEERLRNTSDSNSIPLMKDSSGKHYNMDLDDSFDEHVSRLVEERDTLLRTGVYTSQDKIIAELDRQIKEAISFKKGS